MLSKTQRPMIEYRNEDFFISVTQSIRICKN